jgi:hypothetical protein
LHPFNALHLEKAQGKHFPSKLVPAAVHNGGKPPRAANKEGFVVESDIKKSLHPFRIY